MINLNKKLISKEELFKHVSDADIYRFYTGEDIVFNKSLISPLRDERNPSFGYFTNDHDEICFNDYVLGGGDCIRFVELLFGITYFEALSRIATDFDLSDMFLIKPMPKKSTKVNFSELKSKEDLLKNKQPIKLEKKRRKWRVHDVLYWNQFGIRKSTLNKYNVEPVSYIFINGTPIAMSKHAYCFIEYKDKKETYKIYQPFSKKYKWRNNHDSSVWQGWKQLPTTGDIVIITKSLKDVMSIVSTTDYAAVSMQAESTKPKDIVVEELKERFKKVYVLYDNDMTSDTNWGQKLAVNLVGKYGLENVVIPSKYECKDYSDLVKKHGPEKAREILNEAILNSLPF